MQTITVAGKIGRNAETRQTNNDSVTSFTVAVDQRNGRDKTTNWWRVSVWGKRGQALEQYLTKGASVTVSGAFTLGEYDGKPQLNISASEIALQGGGQARPGKFVNDGDGWAGKAPADDLGDDSIPF